MRTVDDLRATRPDLGFALYAYEPGGVVTLEVHMGGDVFSFTAESEAAAVQAAFPPAPPPAEPEDIFS